MDQLQQLGYWFYVIIFVAKLVEVSIATIRVVLTAKGNRIAATLLSSAEITIWLLVASTVLLGLHDDPMRAVAYALAYVSGIFLGMLLEDKLALGLAEIECIAEPDEARKITEKLRAAGYGVTSSVCEGMGGEKLALSIKVHRKDITKTLNALKEYEHLFVTVTDIRKLSRGSIGRRVI